MPLDQYKTLARTLGKKMAVIAAVWTVLYFPSQIFNHGLIWPLFGPLFGALVGLWAGWWMAEDAVENAGFSGSTLWIILVAACSLALWLPEKILGLILPWITLGDWSIGFGRWMMLTFATLLAMASAVWRASADD